MHEPSFLEVIGDKINKGLNKITRKFIEESEQESKTKPTIEQVRYIVKPFIDILSQGYREVCYIFNSPMRFGKTQTIWRVLIPLYKLICGGRLTFVFSSSVAEVEKCFKWQSKRKVGGFDYYSDKDDNNILLLSSGTLKNMSGSWVKICEQEIEKFEDEDYGDYTLTVVMLTGFAKEVIDDKTGCLANLVKASGGEDVAPLLIWDECGVDCIPSSEMGAPILGNGSQAPALAGSEDRKFINKLHKLKDKFKCHAVCFSATINPLHQNTVQSMYMKSWYAGENKETKFKNWQKKFDKLLLKKVKFPFEIVKDSIVPPEDSRYTSSVLDDVSKFIENDFSKILEKTFEETMSLNLWNRENWKLCGFTKESPKRNILLALGNDNSESGRNALTFLEFVEGIGVVRQTVRRYNKRVKDEQLKINENQICVSLQDGTFLLSDMDSKKNPLTDSDVERKCNDGSILLLIVKNKFQTGFDCSNFYRTIVCRQFVQGINESKGAEINVQKPGQTSGRAAGTHSGVLGVFGWKGMKKVVSDLSKTNEELAYLVLEWFVKNNSFKAFILVDDENKNHTAISTIEYLKASYPSTKEDFMNYLWDSRWQIDHDFDKTLKEEILSDPIPEELKIHKEGENCPCPNCNLTKGHVKAA